MDWYKTRTSLCNGETRPILDCRRPRSQRSWREGQAPNHPNKHLRTRSTTHRILPTSTSAFTRNLAQSGYYIGERRPNTYPRPLRDGTQCGPEKKGQTPPVTPPNRFASPSQPAHCLATTSQGCVADPRATS